MPAIFTSLAIASTSSRISLPKSSGAPMLGPSTAVLLTRDFVPMRAAAWTQGRATPVKRPDLTPEVPRTLEVATPVRMSGRAVWRGSPRAR